MKKIIIGIIVIALIGAGIYFGNTTLQKGSISYLTRGIVVFPVSVNGYPTDINKTLPNTYVNMYAVTPSDTGYQGVLTSTLSTKENGISAKFRVKPGEIVNFLGFNSETTAKNIKTHTFDTPPYKNFTAQDGIGGQLCQINWADSSSKMKINDAGEESCALSLSIPAQDAAASQ